MAALAYATSSIERAKQRFPYSKNHIRGHGDFALVMKCTTPWMVFLYESANERHAAWERMEMGTCPRGSFRCTHDHAEQDL
jgi:hypothetical protein